MRISKEFKVGIFWIVSLSILYCGGLFLKGSEIFSTNRNYYAYVDNVNGLVEGSKIFINGAKIGFVKQLEFLPEDNFRTRVTLSVDKRVQLNKNSSFNSFTSITGSKSLKLILGEGEALKGGEKVQLCEGRDVLSDVMQKGSPIISDVQLVLKNVNLFLEKLNENNLNIKRTIDNLEKTTRDLNATISVLSPEVTKILKNINDNDNGLGAMLTKLNSVANKVDAIEINEIATGMNDCVNRVNALVENIKENPILENTNNTILETQKAIKDLDNLFIDIRRNPHNYVNFSLWGNKKKSNIKE